VKADSRVELYREVESGSHYQILAAPGLVTKDDLKAWK
jgi:hypothetical protein